MRILTLIMSLYMLVLTAAPCTDFHENEEILHVEDLHHHDDTCPPLCYCSCCGMIIQITSIDFGIKPFIEVVELPIQNEIDKTSFIPSFVGNIWTPPKI